MIPCLWICELRTNDEFRRCDASVSSQFWGGYCSATRSSFTYYSPEALFHRAANSTPSAIVFKDGGIDTTWCRFGRLRRHIIWWIVYGVDADPDIQQLFSRKIKFDIWSCYTSTDRAEIFTRRRTTSPFARYCSVDCRNTCDFIASPTNF